MLAMTETCSIDSGLLGLLAAVKAADVLPSKILRGPSLQLDLSVNNAALAAVDLENTEALENYIFSQLTEAGVPLGIGGYGEDRGWYARGEQFHNAEEVRSIHVGVDLWVRPQTPVFAVLAGKVHSFQHNDLFGDYGPTVILQHEIEGYTFYTLYGHLSLDSLEDKQVGQAVFAGEQIAHIGNYPVNGNWPPHLHFQIIRDMLGKTGDFPAVALRSEKDYWLALCPDPNLLLRL